MAKGEIVVGVVLLPTGRTLAASLLRAMVENDRRQQF
jgi:hypothetical protein